MEASLDARDYGNFRLDAESDVYRDHSACRRSRYRAWVRLDACSGRARSLWGYMAPTGFFLPGVPSFEGWGGGERREGSPMAPNRACVGQKSCVLVRGGLSWMLELDALVRTG
jgi:hypothetical protein